MKLPLYLTQSGSEVLRPKVLTYQGHAESEHTSDSSVTPRVSMVLKSPRSRIPILVTPHSPVSRLPIRSSPLYPQSPIAVSPSNIPRPPISPAHLAISSRRLGFTGSTKSLSTPVSSKSPSTPGSIQSPSVPESARPLPRPGSIQSPTILKPQPKIQESDKGVRRPTFTRRRVASSPKWTQEEDQALTNFVLLHCPGNSWPSTKDTRLWEGAAKFVQSMCKTNRTSE